MALEDEKEEERLPDTLHPKVPTWRKGMQVEIVYGDHRGTVGKIITVHGYNAIIQKADLQVVTAPLQACYERGMTPPRITPQQAGSLISGIHVPGVKAEDGVARALGAQTGSR